MVKTKRLKLFLSLNDVKYVIFDLDDTLIDTVEIINHFKSEYVKNISSRFRIDIITVRKKVDQFDYISFNKFGARKLLRWGYLSFLIIKYFHIKYFEMFMIAKSTLKNIYRTAPKVRNGTFEFISVLQREKILFFLLTNSNKKWTNFKLKMTGLNKCFVCKNIYVVNKKSKTISDLKKVIIKNSLNVNNVLVIGDSTKSDINPALNLGIQTIIQITSDIEKTKIDDRVLKIKDLSIFFKAKK